MARAATFTVHGAKKIAKVVNRISTHADRVATRPRKGRGVAMDPYTDFAVKVALAGGVAGGVDATSGGTADCSFAYAVTWPDGLLISATVDAAGVYAPDPLQIPRSTATCPMQPQRARVAGMKHEWLASLSEYGAGFFNERGDFVLTDVYGERMVAEDACPPPPDGGAP